MADCYGVVFACFEFFGYHVGFDDFAPFDLEEVCVFAACLVGQALAMAEKLEAFIADAKALALSRLERGMSVPGYKLVAKRATRQWADESKAREALLESGIDSRDIMSLNTPTQIEKVCKALNVTFPTDQVVSVSSGNTLAPESDKRPAVLVLGEQLRAALNRVK